jgi:hypothetical protein
VYCAEIFNDWRTVMDNQNNQKTTEPNKSDKTYTPRFQLGQLYATPGAQAALERCQTNPFDLAKCHAYGDWGTVCPEDA